MCMMLRSRLPGIIFSPQTPLLLSGRVKSFPSSPLMRMGETSEAGPVPAPTRWIDKIVRDSAKKDTIKGSDLVGEFFGLALMCIALWFFVAHKLNETGFYTDDFGAAEMFAMYSAGAFVVFVAALRIVVRRHNVVRPFEAASMVYLAAAHAVLLASFPFEFEHVSAVLPGSLEWLVSWMSNTFGKIILAIGIPAGLLGAALVTSLYFGVRKEMQKPLPEQSDEPPSGDD